MTFKNFVCKGILVFAGLLLLGWIGKYIYMVDGEIDWFRFMLVYGVPVGIPHMFIISISCEDNFAVVQMNK